MPTVSVIVTTFNHGKFVASALRSLFSQDYQDSFEIVVCDDASSDDTLENIKALADEKPAHISLVFPAPSPNLGLIRNLERGVALATGSLLVLQSGDDLSAPNRLSQLVNRFAERPGLMAAYSNAILVDADDRVLRPLYHPPGFVWNGNVLALAGCASAFLGASSCYRREVWEKFGGLDSRIIQEDLVLPFRAALLGATAYLAEPLVRYRLHGGNVYFNQPGGLTAQEFRSRRLRMVENQILVHEQRLADLRHLKPAHPQLSLVETAITRQIREARFEVSLEIKNWFGIIIILIRQITGRSFRHTVRLATFHLVPFLYCAYRKRKVI